jgi:hypothetical protein
MGGLARVEQKPIPTLFIFDRNLLGFDVFKN